MMYADSTILQALDWGLLTQEQLVEIKTAPSVPYVYSLAHLYQTRALRARPGHRRDSVIEKRLSTIHTLTGGHRITVGARGVVTMDERPPKTYYETLRRGVAYEKKFAGITDFLEPEYGAIFQRTVGIDAEYLCTLNDEAVIAYLDERYRTRADKKSFTESVAALVQKTAHLKGYGHFRKIADVMTVLTLVGYLPKRGGTRLDEVWDASHMAYASQGRVLVTADYGVARRARVIYRLLGMETAVTLMDIDLTGS